jgi:hypothetical protein
VITEILLVFAFVLAVVSGLVNPATEPWRWRLLCFALACFFLAEVLTRVPVLRQ